ncbi:MAG: TetR/AcrR family transcriptional regulator [Mycobacterium sp.]
MAKQAAAEKRQRRERGSINPDDIIDGAFEIADQVSIDNLSMPLLGKHLGVGVTSIYWYFRKKDDLLNAMTDRALRQYVISAPFVEATDWRETLANHARLMRKTFLASPILTDLILIRGTLSAKIRRLGVQQMEAAIVNLVAAGLSAEDAFDTYSAVTVHVRGSVVLERLAQKTKALQAAEDEGPHVPKVLDPETIPLISSLIDKGYRIAAADEANFAYGLECILDHAAVLIAASEKTSKPASTTKRKSS